MTILMEGAAFPAASLGNPGMGAYSVGGMILLGWHSCMSSNNFPAAILHQ